MTATPNWCIHGVSRRQAMDSSLLCMAANTGMKILEFHHLIWDFFCFIKLRTEKKEEGWCLTFTRVSRLFCVFFLCVFSFFCMCGFFFNYSVIPYLEAKIFPLKKKCNKILAYYTKYCQYLLSRLNYSAIWSIWRNLIFIILEGTQFLHFKWSCSKKLPRKNYSVLKECLLFLLISFLDSITNKIKNCSRHSHIIGFFVKYVTCNSIAWKMQSLT